MKLPNLSDVDISKKATIAVFGAYFVAGIEDIYRAALVTVLLCMAVWMQGRIDMKQNQPEPAPPGPENQE